MPTPKLKPSRIFPNFNGMHAIRARINQVDPDPTRGEFAVPLGTGLTGDYPTYAKHVGTIPKNSVVLPLWKSVEEAFNGTTPTLSIGTAADPDGFGTSAAIAPGSVAAALAQIAAGALTTVTTADTPVYVEATTAGGTQSAGIADLLLIYYPMRD